MGPRLIESKDVEPQIGRNHRFRGPMINYLQTFYCKRRSATQPLCCSGLSVLALGMCFQRASFRVPLPYSSSSIIRDQDIFWQPLPQKNLIPKDKQLSNSSLTSKSEWNLFSSCKFTTFSLIRYQGCSTMSDKIMTVMKEERHTVLILLQTDSFSGELRADTRLWHQYLMRKTGS